MRQAPKALGAALRHRRLALGKSQQAVARAAGLTQAHISLIERGMDGHISVVERVARAVGSRLTFEPATIPPIVEKPYGEDEIANRLYLLGRLAAKRLSADRLARFRAWLEEARARVGDYPYFRQWLDITDRGPDAVADMFVRGDELGRYMRSVATFRPFVSQAERDSFFRRNLPAEVAAP